jgi:hypothetical protein
MITASTPSLKASRRPVSDSPGLSGSRLIRCRLPGLPRYRRYRRQAGWTPPDGTGEPRVAPALNGLPAHPR